MGIIVMTFRPVLQYSFNSLTNSLKPCLEPIINLSYNKLQLFLHSFIPDLKATAGKILVTAGTIHYSVFSIHQTPNTTHYTLHLIPEGHSRRDISDRRQGHTVVLPLQLQGGRAHVPVVPAVASCTNSSIKTSLLRRLQVQTLPDEAPPMGKIHQFSKNAVTFDPIMPFKILNLPKICKVFYFMTQSTILNDVGLAAP